MSDMSELIDELNMWIERGIMPTMTTQKTLSLLDEIKRLQEEGKKDYADMRRFQNKFIESDQKVRSLEADYSISNRELLILLVETNRLACELARRDEQRQMDESNHEYEIHRRDETIRKLKEDAERLAKAKTAYRFVNGTIKMECPHCHSVGFGNTENEAILDFTCKPDCPITLHGQLMKEIGGEK